MNYWVNVSPMRLYTWRAMVHEGTCYIVAKYAYGNYKVRDWRSFGTKEQAIRFAESTGREIRKCFKCSP